MLTIADGVNLGVKSMRASRHAVSAATDHLVARLGLNGLRSEPDALVASPLPADQLDTRALASLLIEALYVSQNAIVANEGGSTTICFGVLLRLKHSLRLSRVQSNTDTFYSLSQVPISNPPVAHHNNHNQSANKSSKGSKKRANVNKLLSCVGNSNAETDERDCSLDDSSGCGAPVRRSSSSNQAASTDTNGNCANTATPKAARNKSSSSNSSGCCCKTIGGDVEYAAVVVNVGDSPAFVFGAGADGAPSGVREVTRGSHPLEVARNVRMTGGAIGEHFEPSNLTYSLVLMRRGDLLFMCTDGISDNFHPRVLRGRGGTSSASSSTSSSSSSSTGPLSQAPLLDATESPSNVSSSSDNNNNIAKQEVVDAEAVAETDAEAVQLRQKEKEREESETLSPAEEYHLQLRNIERAILELEMASNRPLGAQDLCAVLMHHALATTCSKRYIIGTEHYRIVLYRIVYFTVLFHAIPATATIYSYSTCTLFL